MDQAKFSATCGMRHDTAQLLQNFNNLLMNGDKDTIIETININQLIIRIHNTKSDTLVHFPCNDTQHNRTADHVKFVNYKNRHVMDGDDVTCIPLAHTIYESTCFTGSIIFKKNGDPREYTIHTTTESGFLEINNTLENDTHTIHLRNAAPNTITVTIHLHNQSDGNRFTETYYHPNQLTLNGRVQLVMWISLLKLIEHEDAFGTNIYASALKITNMQHVDVISLAINNEHDKCIATIQAVITPVTSDIDKHLEHETNI
jgi:hypothetical protein